MPRKKTQEEFIQEAIKIHGDRYDYSNVEYVNSQSKVKIICKEHGEFEQTPSNHTHKNNFQGCPNCGKISCANTRKLSTDEFINKSKKNHGDTYDYSKTIYHGDKNKVLIICHKHGEFQQLPSNHYKYGCNKCGIEISTIKQTKSISNFIEEAIKIHGDRYDYSKVEYKQALSKVIIICKIHGEFEQTASSHLRGTGCGKCSGVTKKTQEEFIEYAIKIHGDRYDYSKVDYINCKTKVIIICKNHGEFKQIPESHYVGNACPKCSLNGYSKMQIQWLNYLQVSHPYIIQHAENDGEFRIPDTRFSADGFCKETNTVYEFHGDFWHGNPKLFNPDAINACTKTTYGELWQKTQEKKYKIQELGYNYVEIWEYDWLKAIKLVIKIQRIWRKYLST